MFSSACHGLQLCLEPKVVESHFLWLKPAPPIINFPGIIETPNEPESMSYNEETNTTTNNNNNSNNDDNNNDNDNNSDCKLMGHQKTAMCGWSFLQALASSKYSTDHNEICVHSLVKSTPSSTLNETSLELCTESLGSETGSYDIPLPETVDCNTSKPRENSTTRRLSRSRSFPPPLTSISGSFPGRNSSSKGKENLVIRRTSRGGTFPPPLKSISGSNGVQVTSHREGGRLVVRVVNVPSCMAYFHAERSEGRLRLCILKDAPSILDDDEDHEHEEIVEEDEVVEDVVVNEENGVMEDGVVYEENGVVEEEKCNWGDEDVNGKSGNVGGEIGKGKLARPISCKERGCGRKGLRHWEQCLVAT